MVLFWLKYEHFWLLNLYESFVSRSYYLSFHIYIADASRFSLLMFLIKKSRRPSVSKLPPRIWRKLSPDLVCWLSCRTTTTSLKKKLYLIWLPSMVVTLINLVAVSVSKHLHLDLSGSIIGLFEKQQNSSFRYQHWTCIQTGYYASWNHVGKGQRTCLHSFFDVTVDKEAERLAEEMGMDYVPTLYKGFFDSYPRNSGYYLPYFRLF